MLNLLFLGLSLWAFEANKLYDGVTSQETDLASIVRAIPPGSIVVVGENHGFTPIQQQQIQVLKELAKQNNTISLGMEFFYYPDQPYVDQYLSGKLPEDEFLKKIDWGLPSFDFYRDQVNFPRQVGGEVIALNAPRTLTGRISKVGIAKLTPAELALMPPNFQLGNDLYSERFSNVMGGHVPPSAVQRYFEAQSVWDETMAWNALKFQKDNPDKILMIIVGEFHVAYGGGLPDRLTARGAPRVYTIAQVNINGMTPDEVKEEVAPHSRYGKRGDWVWTSDFATEKPYSPLMPLLQ